MEEQPVKMTRLQKIGWCAVPVSILLAILGILYAGVFVHDQMLWQFSRTYADIKHPSGTQSVKQYRELGLLAGNGNHCDLFVGELRSYSGSREHVLKCYSSQIFWVAYTEEYVSVKVWFLENGRLEQGRYRKDELDYKPPHPVEHIAAEARRICESTKRHYIIYMFDPCHDTPRLDPRCM